MCSKTFFEDLDFFILRADEMPHEKQRRRRASHALESDHDGSVGPRRCLKNTLRARRAFTLVELMVVIVIIGLLAGAVTMGVRSYLVAGKQNVAKMEISSVSQALETFYSVYDRYPSNEEGLEILTQPSEKLVDGLLSKMPKDPWGRPYQFNQPGRNGPYEVICFGADGREGGEGADRDISSDDLGEDD